MLILDTQTIGRIALVELTRENPELHPHIHPPTTHLFDGVPLHRIMCHAYRLSPYNQASHTIFEKGRYFNFLISLLALP